MNMVPIRQWPAPILRRWLGLPSVGLGCLLVGCVGGIALKDSFLFFLSAAVCGACLVKAFLFYRLVSRQEYEVMEGVCIEVQQRPFQRGCKAKFVDASDHIHTLPLEKGIRVCVGRQYRFYLRKQDDAAKAAAQSLPISSTVELLGYEEIDGTLRPAGSGDSV